MFLKSDVGWGVSSVYTYVSYVLEQRVDFVSLAAGLGCVSHALWFNLPKETLHARVLAGG